MLIKYYNKNPVRCTIFWLNSDFAGYMSKILTYITTILHFNFGNINPLLLTLCYS